MSVVARPPQPAISNGNPLRIPAPLHVLYVTSQQRTGAWLVESLSGEGALDVRKQEAVGRSSALARLRDEVCDAMLLSHDPPELDALELLGAARAGGIAAPAIVLGIQSEQEIGDTCFQAGADAYLCANTATTRRLAWALTHGVHRYQLEQENRRLRSDRDQRLRREHEEAARIIRQQWELVCELHLYERDPVRSELPPSESCVAFTRPDLPGELICHYRELLRTYVIMGSGNLARDLENLVRVLAELGVNARQTLQLHVFVLAELVRGLGSRSTRHVMTRADLLALEIISHLAEAYQTRYRSVARPAVQRWLPGFEDAAA